MVYEPQRARGSDSPTSSAPDVADPEIAYRIKIDPERLAAEQGALLMQESPFEPEEAGRVHGRDSVRAADQTEADAITDQCDRGLRWTTNFGAERTAGFGRLVGVDVQSAQTLWHRTVVQAPGPPRRQPVAGAW